MQQRNFEISQTARFRCCCAIFPILTLSLAIKISISVPFESQSHLYASSVSSTFFSDRDFRCSLIFVITVFPFSPKPTMSKFGNLQSDGDPNDVTIIRKHQPASRVLKSQAVCFTTYIHYIFETNLALISNSIQCSGKWAFSCVISNFPL